MPIEIPTLDNRRYQDLLDEALARIPVHNPEWTNFNKSDPGVTLVEVFAFLAESLLYRANQIPERNRRKFLSLLGIPLRPASSARGIVAFSNERGPLITVTLNTGVEVRAGEVPFRTELGLDVLPVEAIVCYKQEYTDDKLAAYYSSLYKSQLGTSPPKTIRMYKAVPLDPAVGVDIGNKTVDASLWIGLLVRPGDKPYADNIKTAREKIGGRILSLGVVPQLSEPARTLAPGGTRATVSEAPLVYEVPAAPADGSIEKGKAATYKSINVSTTVNVLNEPGIVQIPLPPKEELNTWTAFDPLESGVGDYPPSFEDSNVGQRVITWVRIRSTPGTKVQFLWAGINASMVKQRARILNEVLPPGTGEPDQVAVLAKTPVIPGSVNLTVSGETWEEIDDITAAGPEVPVPDLRAAPGTPVAKNPRVNVYALDPEAGKILFGDGAHGRRPPRDAVIRADYDYGLGDAGNVRDGSINTGPALPAGIKVSNPVRTWGGTAGETVTDGEKQIASYLRHRERLVTVEDFATIARRTPGIDMGRVEVIAAYNPATPRIEPGHAAGAVTLMVIPKYDAKQPDAPYPDSLFTDAVCRYLEPRRLVTTELFVRPPEYVKIWVSAGINVVAGASIAEVTVAVATALKAFLSVFDWPLRKAVDKKELSAVVSRVPGVLSVNSILLGNGETGTERPDSVPMTGLQLPRIAGLSITPNDPKPITDLLGTTGGAPPSTVEGFVPVPVVPEMCR